MNSDLHLQYRENNKGRIPKISVPQSSDQINFQTLHRCLTLFPRTIRYLPFRILVYSVVGHSELQNAFSYCHFSGVYTLFYRKVSIDD